MNPDTKTTIYGVVGGLLSFLADMFSSGQVTIKGAVTGGAIAVLGKFAAGVKK